MIRSSKKSEKKSVGNKLKVKKVFEKIYEI